MAPSCSLNKGERYGRMTIGAGFLMPGFLLHQDTFAAVTLVLGSSILRKWRSKKGEGPGL